MRMARKLPTHLRVVPYRMKSDAGSLECPAYVRDLWGKVIYNEIFLEKSSTYYISLVLDGAVEFEK